MKAKAEAKTRPGEFEPTESWAEREISRFVLGIGAVMAALVGIWGVICLVGGLTAEDGVYEMIRGYIASVTG
jgi:hypothetical protein